MLNIRSDLDKVRRHLEKVQADVQKASARALNNSAFRMAREIGDEVAGAIESPTAFTRKSMVVARKASDGDLSAEVRMKDIQARYLGPLLSGGARVLKPVEQKFMGRSFVPGPGLPLNANGNVPKATLLALLAAVRSGGKGRYKGAVVFLAPSGIYAREGRQRVPLLLFTRAAPSYRKRIDFEWIARSVGERVLAEEFERAISSAIRGG